MRRSDCPGDIEVHLLKYNEHVEHACLGGGGGAVNFNFRRLYGENSPLLKKVKKYSEAINQYNLPFILCIYMDFHTWFGKDDLYHSLYGRSTEHFEECNYYSHLIENSLYYSSPRVMKYVSGILLRQADEYTYYHNFTGSNKLNIENQKILLAWQHPYE